VTTSDLTTYRDEVPVRRPASMTDLPLTAAQQRLWFLDRFQPGWPSHDEMVYRLRGPLDAELLEEALNLVLRRHEAVWARFAERDGEPVQIMAGPGRLNISVVALDDSPAAER
jgi:hypothetical protein